MNGAPAKPINGTSELADDDPDSLEHVGEVDLGLEGPKTPQVLVGRGKAARSPARVLSTISTPTPMAASGTTMSENRMAASTPYRRTG